MLMTLVNEVGWFASTLNRPVTYLLISQNALLIQIQARSGEEIHT